MIIVSEYYFMLPILLEDVDLRFIYNLLIFFSFGLDISSESYLSCINHRVKKKNFYSRPEFFTILAKRAKSNFVEYQAAVHWNSLPAVERNIPDYKHI